MAVQKMQEQLRKIVSRLGERQLIWAVNLLLLLFLMQALADLTWRWLGDSSAEVASQYISQAPLASTASAQVLAQKIANAHLFGKADGGVIASGQTIAPETKLNLILSGAITSKQQSGAVAIIAAGIGATERSYSIGDSLPSGATLKEVYGDKVIIDYRGRVETLTLHRKKLSNKELSIK